MEAGSSDTTLWRIPSVKFVFDSAKPSHYHSRTIGDKTSAYWSPVFRTQPYGYIFIFPFPPYRTDIAAGHFATPNFAFFPRGLRSPSTMAIS